MNRLVFVILFILCSVNSFAIEKSPTVVYINGAKYYVHTVQAGETLYALSKEYGVEESVIANHNSSVNTGLKTGENLRIPYVVSRQQDVLSDKKMKRIFDTHSVAKGETLYGISRRYMVAIPTIVEDNPQLDPVHLKLGEVILIRKKQIGTEREVDAKRDWEQYRDGLNKASDDGKSYYIVKAGDTFYSIARRLEISEEELTKLNNGMRPEELKVGAIIKISGNKNATEVAENTTEEVEIDIAAKPSIVFRALPQSQTLNVSLLLPIAVNGDTNSNYVEFYQGFLLGLDSVRLKNGYSIDLNVFNTEQNPDKVKEITRMREFKNSNIIVGPIYENELPAVVEFAEENAVPVISPLANITSLNSDALFQLAPAPETKYAKMADLLSSDKHIKLIYTATTDKDFEQEILAQIGNIPYTKHTYNYQHHSTNNSNAITQILTDNDQSVIIIMSDNETELDRVLAGISSANTNIVSRGHTAPQYVVLGNARWNRYNNIDRTLLFKNNVVFPSIYHAKRDADVVGIFDSEYIKAFGSLPTLYSYRGYDTAMIFCTAMFGDIEYNMADRKYTPLQTTYLFRQDNAGRNHINQNWPRVSYNSNFTISVE